MNVVLLSLMDPHLTLVSWGLFESYDTKSGRAEAPTLSRQRHGSTLPPSAPEELIPLGFRGISLGQTRIGSSNTGNIVGLANGIK